MRSNSTYVLQLYVKKCKISIKQMGSVGLLLRAGRSQSHYTDIQPIINGAINFNTQIKLNIDQSALDTQRCSLTLNFVSAQNVKRVIGIVVINIPQIGQQVQKTFKVTSTPDKQAQIQLKISVKEIDENNKVKQKVKIAQKPKQKQTSTITPKLQSFAQLIVSRTAKYQEKPTSPPSQSTQKLNLKSERSEIQSIVQQEDLYAVIQKLQKQKQFLKELLKIQMAKSFKVYNHLRSIIQILQTSVGVGIASQDLSLRNTASGEHASSLSKRLSTDSVDFNRLALGLTNNNSGFGSALGVVKESKYEDSPARNIGIKSKNASSIQKSQFFGSQKSSEMMGLLTGLKKKIQDSGKSKDQVRRLFQKIKNEPKVELDIQRVKILKNRIDKVYVGLLTKQVIKKEQVLKHKIQINKILDEVINPLIK